MQVPEINLFRILVCSHTAEIWVFKQTSDQVLPYRRLLSWPVDLCYWHILDAPGDRTGNRVNSQVSSSSGILDYKNVSRIHLQVHKYWDTEHTYSKRGNKLFHLMQSNKKGKNWLFWQKKPVTTQYCCCFTVLVGKTDPTPPNQTIPFSCAITSPSWSQYLPFQFCQHRRAGCDAFSAQQCRLFQVYNLLPN